MYVQQTLYHVSLHIAIKFDEIQQRFARDKEVAFLIESKIININVTKIYP